MTIMDNRLIINFDDFDGPNRHRFLSNFYQGGRIAVFGDLWQTGEHAFQAMKTTDERERDAIRRASSPSAAKRMGRTTELRPDWEAIKYDVMAAVIRAKFRTDREEGAWLINTGDALLVEGTEWGDTVWGTKGRRVEETAQGPDYVVSRGRNWLGTLLMARRAELVAEYKFGIVHATGEANERFSA